MSNKPLRLASRTSPLAMYQAELVADRLRRAHPQRDVVIVGVESAGDKDLSTPIREFAGKGAFTTAVDHMVATNVADIAVHSAKDLPASESDDGMELVAIPDRADARDVLVGSTLAELGVGATIATGSVRRRVQMAFLRPDLGFIDLRGNIATRIDKLPAGGAVLIAKAALDRLAIDVADFETLSPTVMLPQVGQGAIALRMRRDDDELRELVGAINDDNALAAVKAERSFLRYLGGGCDAPVGAHATCTDGTITIAAMIASADGHIVTRTRHSGQDAEMVGAEIARELLVGYGAENIVAELVRQ